MTDIKFRSAAEGPFPINHKLAGIVPMALPFEQAILIEDIRTVGQREPVVLWKGQVIDGRCRQRALVGLSKQIMYKELDDELTEEEVKTWVKSMNTRRNLTSSQRIAIACKQYVEYKATSTVPDVAKAWGIGEAILHNALWIYKQDPAVIETIFDGGSVPIADKLGKLIESNKITSIYAYMKKKAETVVITDSAWKPDAFIKTQVGKEWFYEQMKQIGEIPPYARLLIAELANLKFATPIII
jgi:hypothetical protein